MTIISTERLEEITPELLAATSSIQDITFRANELGIGLAKYPVSDIEAVLRFVSASMAEASYRSLDKGEAEPVAWRFRYKGDTAWTLLTRIIRPSDDLELQPLYASPQPAPKGVEIRESLADLVFNAILDCPHSITGEEIVLGFSSDKPGLNATAQLHARVGAVMKEA